MESEKAKAEAGKLYDANNDIELVSEREACKEVCYELNSLRPSQKKERENIIRRLFGKTGKSFLIEQPFYCDYGYNYRNRGELLFECELRHSGWSESYIWR